MIKAIFFDIDGTLVSFNTHRVPESTAHAIKELRKKEVKVFIATGRHLSAIDNLETLEFDGYVTLNGGYCYAGKDKAIYKHPIPKEDIKSLIRFLEEDTDFPCVFVREHDLFMNYQNETTESLFNLLNFPVPAIAPIQDALKEDIFQLIAFFTEEQKEHAMTALPHCEATSWHPSFADVVPAGSNKSIGIDKIIEYFGISLNETMAFGDGGNDISMLKHAGLGVAMGNAKEEVKQKADYVTTSVDEDGIANALKHFGIID